MTIPPVTIPPVLREIEGGLVVSCQAYPGEPMRDPAVMTAVALAVLAGGAVGLRAQGLADVAMIRSRTSAPLIGLVKTEAEDVFITPTRELATAVREAGADVVAVDGTDRPRPDGLHLADTVAAVHAAGGLVMADCGSLVDARHSVESGADCVGTTLAGYTGARPAGSGPDLELLAELVAEAGVPVIAEGRVRSPGEARRCLELGAFAVVVGTAITHPTRITQAFAAEVGQAGRREDSVRRA